MYFLKCIASSETVGADHDDYRLFDLIYAGTFSK